MSQKNVEEFGFVWKIRNFSLCFQKNGEALTSPYFTTEKFGGSQWNLLLYPKGYRQEDNGYISLFLRKGKNDLYSDINTVSYDLAIVGLDGSNLQTVRLENHTFKKEEAFGPPRFLNLSKLNNGPEDVLVVRCRIFADAKDKLPDHEACTVIGVDHASFLWEMNFPVNSKKEATSEIVFSPKSLYIIKLEVIDDKVTISIRQKEEDSVLSKCIRGKLSVVTAEGKVSRSETDVHLFQANVENEPWEFPQFIPRELFDLELGNVFSILCEFFASGRISSELTVGSKSNDCSHTRMCPNLLKDMNNMLRNQVYTDVALKAGEDVVNAHRSILAARSTVFAAMFDQDMIESRTGTVEISDVDPNTLKSFLEFIYTGKVEDFDYEMANELLLVAEKYQVLTLKEKCASFLESVLSLKNVCEVLVTADLISHEQLKKTAMNFVAMNSKIVFNLPEWSNLVQKNIKLAEEIFLNLSANFSRYYTPKKYY